MAEIFFPVIYGYFVYTFLLLSICVCVFFSAFFQARIHPFHILVALETYKGERGYRGKLRWQPDKDILEALDISFYKTFKVIWIGRSVLHPWYICTVLDTFFLNIPHAMKTAIIKHLFILPFRQ